MNFFSLFFMGERLFGKMSKMKVEFFFLSPFQLLYSVEVNDFSSLLLEFVQQRKRSTIALWIREIEREKAKKRRNKSVPHPKCTPNEKMSSNNNKNERKILITKQEEKVEIIEWSSLRLNSIAKRHTGQNVFISFPFDFNFVWALYGFTVRKFSFSKTLIPYTVWRRTPENEQI